VTPGRTTARLWRGRALSAPVEPWPDGGHVDDVVVGAGLTGLTTALLLAREGRRVVVLEARQIGAVTTGASTGKVSLLQGTKLSRILSIHSERVGQAYVEANREGQQWLLTFCEAHDVPFQFREAVTYAASEEELRGVRDEHAAAQRLGLDVTWHDSLDLPFPVHGATILRDQAQLDPMEVLGALADAVRAHGGSIFEGCRVTGVSKLGRPTVTTADGRRLGCENVVLATGTPMLDRGLYFAKLEAKRSYLLAFASADAPVSMLLSAGTPTRSVRDVPQADGLPLMLVGGSGHIVGRVGSEADQLDELRSWAGRYFSPAAETHAWSAQDYTSHDGIPYVGTMPRGWGRIYVATGFDKWGLSNGVAAARNISGRILGSTPSWAKPLGRRITHPRAAAHLVTANLRIGAVAASSLVRAELAEAEAAPAEGQGSVGRSGLSPVPVATSTAEQGATCTVSAICTHLGGTLHWNDAERTWDCPLHGSRFAPDGAVLEGPATDPLMARGP